MCLAVVCMLFFSGLSVKFQHLNVFAEKVIDFELTLIWLYLHLPYLGHFKLEFLIHLNVFLSIKFFNNLRNILNFFLILFCRHSSNQRKVVLRKISCPFIKHMVS